MESFTVLAPTDFVSDSRELLMNNDQTLRSNSAGTAFPTTNLFRGMFCLRTDLGTAGQMYQCTDPVAPTWKLIFDLAKTVLHKEEADGYYAGSVHAHAQYVIASGPLMTGNGLVQRVGADGTWDFQSDAGKSMLVRLLNGNGNLRWTFGKTSETETGAGNAGSNFSLDSYSDAGSAIGNVLAIARSSRIVTFAVAPKVGDNLIWHAGNDGNASGLDADLLGGVANTNFARKDVAQTYTKPQRQGVDSIAYAATVTLDLALNACVEIGTLTGNLTLANPTNQVAGQSGWIVLVQDGTGGRTISFGTNWKKTGGTAPIPDTTAGSVNIVYYTVRASGFIHYAIAAKVS